jgi:hypothetical protein
MDPSHIYDHEEDVDNLSDGEEELDSEAIHLGPGGIDDPDTSWDVGDEARPFPVLSPGDYYLLIPGEDVQVVARLPKPRNLRLGIAVSTQSLVVCVGRRRSWSRSPGDHSTEHADAPQAERMLVVFIAHRARGNPTKPRKYIVITGPDDEMLGWLDYSNEWNLDARALKEMAETAGIEYVIERFTSEADFERAHPRWVG